MSSRRLPDLGPRGEGWFALQLALFALVGVSASLGPDWSGPLRIATLGAGVLLAGAGAILSIRGVLDLRENLSVFPRPVEGARLVDTGAYGLVRHPIYGGLIVAAAGWGLIAASLVTLAAAALLAAFFELKSRREELWLAERLPGYDRYRRRTRKLVPWLY